MKGKGIGISKVVHIGVVVKDLERSMEQYFRTMGIGPWHVYTLRPPFLQEIFFGKEKIYLAMKLAMAQLGNVAMELIQPISEGNPYTEFLERCGEGVHHLGVEVEDYEQALSFFKERGMLDKVQLHYTYPIGRVHSLENVAKWAQPEFDRMGITYETLFNMKEVDGKAKVLRSEEGSEAKFDLLVAIPPHRGMEVIEKNGLGQNGWIPTHRQRLNMEGRENVFVLGDTTNLPISKAGSTAHFEAETLGENIAALVKMGTVTRDYDGKVFCFIEAGKNRATYAMFNYTNPPEPREPTRAVHWFKTAYNKLYWTSARGLL